MKIRNLCLLSGVLALMLFGHSKIKAEDYIVIQNGTGVHGSEVGSSYVYEGHRPGALEGLDTNDVLRSTSSSSKTNWLSIWTQIEDKLYRKDFRPENSETPITNYLSIVGEVSNCPNRLSFSASDLEANRVYSFLVDYFNTNFSRAVSIKQIINENGGDFQLPNITGTNGQVYAQVVIGSKYIRRPHIDSVDVSSNICLEASVQPGSFSGFEGSTNLSFNGNSSKSFVGLVAEDFDKDHITQSYYFQKDKNCFFRVRSSSE